jgi:hypothetical protein
MSLLAGVTLWTLNMGIIVYLIRRDMRLAHPFAALWIGLLVIFLLPSAVDLFQAPIVVDASGYALYSISGDVLAWAQAYLAYLLVAYVCLEKALSECVTAVAHPVDMTRIRRNPCGMSLFWALLAASLGVFAYLIQSRGVFTVLTFTEFRSDLPFWMIFSLQILPKYYVGTVAFLWTEKRRAALMVFVIACSIIFMVTGGTRQTMAMVAMGLAVGYVWQRRHSPGVVIRMVVLVAIGTSALFPLLYLRNLEGFDARLEALAAPIDTFLHATEGFRGEWFVRGAYYFVLDDGDSIHDAFHLSYLVRTLLWFLPSAIAHAIKPADFEYNLCAAFYGTECTLHPTLPGMIYADAALLGVLWIALLIGVRACATVVLAHVTGPRFAAYHVLVAFAGLMMSRGSLYAPIVIIMSGAGLLWTLERGFWAEKVTTTLSIRPSAGARGSIVG